MSSRFLTRYPLLRINLQYTNFMKASARAAPLIPGIVHNDPAVRRLMLRGARNMGIP